MTAAKVGFIRKADLGANRSEGPQSPLGAFGYGDPWLMLIVDYSRTNSTQNYWSTRYFTNFI
jgi:hypothetical protein